MRGAKKSISLTTKSARCGPGLPPAGVGPRRTPYNGARRVRHPAAGMLHADAAGGVRKARRALGPPSRPCASGPAASPAPAPQPRRLADPLAQLRVLAAAAAQPLAERSLWPLSLASPHTCRPAGTPPAPRAEQPPSRPAQPPPPCRSARGLAPQARASRLGPRPVSVLGPQPVSVLGPRPVSVLGPRPCSWRRARRGSCTPRGCVPGGA